MCIKKSNILINFIELKYRLIYLIYGLIFTFCVSFYYRVELFFLISKFVFILICPLVIYLLGFFFFKSFYSSQLWYFIIYLFCTYFISLILFFFLTKTFLPFLLEFLIDFQRLDNSSVLELKLQATITQYYSFFFTYVIIYLILVLIPNIFLFLVLVGLITSELFFNHFYRKYIYFVVFIFFLIIAPPDFLLQLSLVPFVLVFLEVYIFFITFFYHFYLTYVELRREGFEPTMK